MHIIVIRIHAWVNRPCKVYMPTEYPAAMPIPRVAIIANSWYYTKNLICSELDVSITCMCCGACPNSAYIHYGYRVMATVLDDIIINACLL